MAEDRYLPGTPKKALVQAVKRQLASYGIRPTLARLWHETWQWANAIAHSYALPRKHWPLPNEIAAQYVLLLMLEMHSFQHLKLPYRAGSVRPESIQRKLAGGATPLLLPME